VSHPGDGDLDPRFDILPVTGLEPVLPA
jgi:hypothetical protein